MPSVEHRFSEGIYEYAYMKSSKVKSYYKIKYISVDMFKYLQIMLILFMTIWISIS